MDRSITLASKQKCFAANCSEPANTILIRNEVKALYSDAGDSFLRSFTRDECIDGEKLLHQTLNTCVLTLRKFRLRN